MPTIGGVYIPGVEFTTPFKTSNSANNVNKVIKANEVFRTGNPEKKVETPVESDTILKNGSADSYNYDAVQETAQTFNDYASQFNSAEAQKQRDWQEYMSSTAHQREVADLKAAGLNPVLSAGGNGAAMASGASASYENASSALLGFLAQALNAETNIKTAQIMANANLGSAMMSSSASRYNTDLMSKVFRQNALTVQDTETFKSFMSLFKLLG